MAIALGTSEDPQVGEQLDALVLLARDLGARGWTPARSGNYSVRLADRSIAVTRSGTDKRHLDRSGLMAVDATGVPLAGGQPSAELGLHVQLYGFDPSIGAVLHVHSPCATVASRLAAGGELIRLENYELLKAFDGVSTHAASLAVPVVANDQDIAVLAARVAPHLRRGLWCYLIEGHGVYAWGRDLVAAARHLEAIEFLLSCHLEERRLRT